MLEKISDSQDRLFAFYTFLVCVDNNELAQILDFLEKDAIAFLQLFGGTVLKIPTIYEFEEAKLYFEIMEEYSKIMKILDKKKLENHIKEKYDLTSEDYKSFLKYFNKFKKNHSELFRKYIERKNDD